MVKIIEALEAISKQDHAEMKRFDGGFELSHKKSRAFNARLFSDSTIFCGFVKTLPPSIPPNSMLLAFGGKNLPLP